MEQLQAYLALPESGQGAGVLLIHAWWGLTDFFKAVCDRLAGEGFVVLAPDLYDGATAATIEEAAALRDALDQNLTASRLLAAVETLKTHPAVSNERIGVVGFSLGASYGLWLSNQRPDEIAALVVFYGTYDGDLTAMRAAFLGHFAENDPYEPHEALEQLDQTLTSLNREATFYVYAGTGHWFFESDRPAYHAESARLAWEWTLKFLHEKL